MSILSKLLIAGLLVAGSAGIATADETVLLFGTGDAPTNPINTTVHHPWAEAVNKDGAGAVKIDVRDGPTVANVVNSYSRVMDDVIQIGWGLPAYASGKFKLTNVAALPGLFVKSEAGSVALWKLFASGALKAEFDEAVPLSFVAFPQTIISLTKAPASIDNLNGLKIAVGSNKIYADIVTDLGGTPVSIPLGEYYQGLQRGTVDGCITIWSQLTAFKLAEVTSHHIDIPLAGATGMVFMSRAKYDSLSPEAKKAIDAHAGEDQSRFFGQFYDKWNAEARAEVLGMSGHTLLEPTDAQKAAWYAAIKPVVTGWSAANEGGEQAVADFQKYLEEAMK